MVARGAGAVGPVLLACRQWDPLGLARRLPSLGFGAPLLPWRVQCPVRVCAALAAGSGGSGRYLVLCLSRSPIPPRVSRTACGGPSRPGVPYPRSLVRHSTRSVRSASSVRLPFWLSPCVLCVCVRSRSRGIRSPPPLDGVACAPRAVPALGAGRAVPRGPCPSACPAPVPCFVWRPWGGRSGPGSPLPGLGLLLRGASGVRRFPSPGCPPSGPAAGAHYPLAVGAGGCGRGDPSPTPQRVLVRADFARCGGGTSAPGGAASCLGVGRPGSGALPPPTARPLGGLSGPTTHWLWVRGGACVGTRHRPHSARSCVLWGRHEGARGGRLLPGCVASGVRRSPITDCPPSGPGAGAHYPLAVGAGGCGHGDPSPTPQRAPLRAGFARCRGGTRAPREGASCLGVGRPGSGALPPPTARPLGRRPGPTTHWLWVRGGAGVGTRHEPHSARSCVLWGRHEDAPGGRLLPGCGASGVGRSPNPNCPPSGRAAGAHYPLAVGVGGCGRGDPSPIPQRALLCAVGAA